MASVSGDTTLPFNLMTLLPFERDFDAKWFLQWMLKNWTLCFWFAVPYVVFIFVGRYYMDKRPPFELRRPLAFWSAALAVFSILGAVRTTNELVNLLLSHGFDFALCHPIYYPGPRSFWGCMFVWSKVYELGDTVFIVLRKQKLLFLHWYHHVITLIYVWYSYAAQPGTGRWFATMNFIVHAAMYTHYALRALRFRIPRRLSISITTLQIVQMFVGTFMSVRAYQIKMRGDFCDITVLNLRYSLVIYASFFALFAYYFYDAYLKPKHPPSKDGVGKQQ